MPSASNSSTSSTDPNRLNDDPHQPINVEVIIADAESDNHVVTMTALASSIEESLVPTQSAGVNYLDKPCEIENIVNHDRPSYCSIAKATAWAHDILLTHGHAVETLEGTLRNIAYLLPGRFRKSELLAELLHASVDLFDLLTDPSLLLCTKHITGKKPLCILPYVNLHSKHKAAYLQWLRIDHPGLSKYVTMLNVLKVLEVPLEVVMNLTLDTNVPAKGHNSLMRTKMPFLLLIEASKSLMRLAIWYKTRRTMLSSYTMPSRELPRGDLVSTVLYEISQLEDQTDMLAKTAIIYRALSKLQREGNEDSARLIVRDGSQRGVNFSSSINVREEAVSRFVNDMLIANQGDHYTQDPSTLTNNKITSGTWETVRELSRIIRPPLYLVLLLLLDHNTSGSGKTTRKEFVLRWTPWVVAALLDTLSISQDYYKAYHLKLSDLPPLEFEEREHRLFSTLLSLYFKHPLKNHFITPVMDKVESMIDNVAKHTGFIGRLFVEPVVGRMVNGYRKLYESIYFFTSDS